MNVPTGLAITASQREGALTPDEMDARYLASAPRWVRVAIAARHVALVLAAIVIVGVGAAAVLSN